MGAVEAAVEPQGESLHAQIFGAHVKAAGEVGEALKPETVKAAWAQCGFSANEKFNDDKIFIQRREEIFQRMRDAPDTPATFKVFTMVQQIWCLDWSGLQVLLRLRGREP